MTQLETAAAGPPPRGTLDHDSVMEVLVVDDSAFVRQALQTALDTDSTLDVITARNGKEALDILKCVNNIGALVLDVSMPIVGGVEVLRQLDATLVESLHIITIGERSHRHLLEESIALGADETLSKPLDVDSLRSMLRRAAGS